jgi:murein DD-endopeptidase MepM/ murein hydrolase activator NlpD
VRARPQRASSHWIVVATVAAFCAPAGWSQAIYRAEQSDGVPSYTDRPIANLPSELVRDAGNPPAAIGVELVRRDVQGVDALTVVNHFFGPIQIAVYASYEDYVAGEAPLNGFPVLQAKSESLLHTLSDTVSRRNTNRFHLVHIPGDPNAEHRNATPYRLPYAVATQHLVSQAYPELITHTDPSSEHAIDFEMPVGTGVHAARAGIVMDVAADNYRAAPETVDPEAPANIVRVLHDDGTMALYGHLQLHSIRVVPGQHVARGEYIADSGNTGFSTGPHLHFVVQRNDRGRIVSVPVEFATLDGVGVHVQRGQSPTAY